MLAGVAFFGALVWWGVRSHQVSGADDVHDGVDLDISSRVIVPELKPILEDTQNVSRGLEEDESDDGMKDARLKSAIMVQDGFVQAGGEAGVGAKDKAIERGPTDSNARFVQSVSGHAVPSSQAQQIFATEYKVLQGKMIEAVLESRAMSDLPGMVCATVQRDVYGAQKRRKLIPWGSRVCGQYSAEVRTGQDRLFVVWNTLRRPDGVEVTLDSTGADQLGTAGMGGLVDTHFANMFGVSSLLSIIGAGSGSVRSGAYDPGNSGSYYRDSVQMAASQTAQQILQPYINMQPTITVPAGARIRIYVNRDLDFSDIYAGNATTSSQHDVLMFN